MRPGNFKDRTGQKFGRLTAISYIPKFGGKGAWLCDCSCGNQKVIPSSSMGITRSCGCLRAETTSRRRKTHGLAKTRVYRVWAAMKRRCQLPTDSAYDKYGAKGIKVCERWQSFENFYADMGEPPSVFHSIERVDYRGDYTPENCKWATPLDQANNKSNNVFLTFAYEGVEQTKTVPQWSRVSGVAYHTIRKRLEKGIEPYQAVFTPASPYRKF